MPRVPRARAEPRLVPGDGLLVALALGHGAALAAGAAAVIASGASAPLVSATGVALVGLGLWWGGNTVAHNFVHRPFFGARLANRAFSLYLSVVLGFPQTAWRELHLAHHAGRAVRVRLRPALLVETLAVLGLLAAAAVLAPSFLVSVYLPGLALGLGLGLLQGRGEHRPATASYYGRLYNVCFLNDGYHVEHHAAPHAHWTELPRRRAAGPASRYPPVLRWIEGACSLEALERRVLRSPRLEAWLVRCHARAFAALAPRAGRVRTVTIVGGALFPRSAIVCRALFPDARIRVVDGNADNIATARALLDDAAVEYRHAVFEPGSTDRSADLYVIPLALRGDRAAVYASPPGRRCIVHDWIWNRRGVATAVVSPLLLKRVNLVEAQ